MIKIALSGLVGFALGATVTSVPIITHHENAAVEARAPASVDPFALTKNAKDLGETEVLNYF